MIEIQTYSGLAQSHLRPVSKNQLLSFTSANNLKNGYQTIHRLNVSIIPVNRLNDYITSTIVITTLSNQIPRDKTYACASLLQTILVRK